MTQKTKNIIGWVIIALLALQFLMAGIGKLAGGASTMAERWGYSTNFMYMIAVLELLGAAGLFIPKLRKWAAFGLIGLMLGAAYTHFTHSEWGNIVYNLIIILLAGGLVWLKAPSKSA